MGIFSFFKKKEPQKQPEQQKPLPTPQSEQKEKEHTFAMNETAEFHVKIKTQYVNNISPVKLSRIPFHPLCGGRGAYLNFREYLIEETREKGKNRSFRCKCNSEQKAIELALQAGLMEPYDIQIIEPDPPTDRQLSYAKDLGILIDQEDMSKITKIDISYMISRALGEDSKESPTPEMVAMAEKIGWQGSAYVGKHALISELLKQSDERTHIALYAYAVHQQSLHKSLANMFDDGELDLYFSFADQVMEMPAVLKSIKSRTAEDYFNPSKGTNAYKAVKEFLKK